ncbi:ferredoxin family protein, partial [candidate division KSB1 bacterium]|nr:ferredoxin family protein [candidate division KSB1 bacterium]
LVWLFGGLALSGFIYEIGIFRTWFIPFTKITVDQNRCTSCLKCDKACPYGISVHTYQKVTHPDCMLCTECIWACDKEKAVSINRNPNLSLLPELVVILLLAGGFWAGSQFEFKTYEIRWGDFEKLPGTQIYEQSGLKSVKCYGSSVALYRKIKDIHGIYGLDTYAGTNSVKIYYNPAEINPSDIKKALFQPARYKVQEIPPVGIDSLSIWMSDVENLFDAFDNYYLLNLLSKREGIYGFETYYGEPARAAVFYDASQISAEEISQLINETKSLEIDPGEAPIQLNFQALESKVLDKKLGRDFLNRRIFPRYFVEFNQDTSGQVSNLHIYEIGILNIDNMQQKRQLPYLVSHLSEESGLQGFGTTFTNRSVALVYFNPTKIDTARIFQIINSDTLMYYKQDDTRGKTANPFRFQYPSHSFPAENFSDPALAAQQLVLE